jgi:hypothetical protein
MKKVLIAIAALGMFASTFSQTYVNASGGIYVSSYSTEQNTTFSGNRPLRCWFSNYTAIMLFDTNALDGNVGWPCTLSVPHPGGNNTSAGFANASVYLLRGVVTPSSYPADSDNYKGYASFNYRKYDPTNPVYWKAAGSNVSAAYVAGAPMTMNMGTSDAATAYCALSKACCCSLSTGRYWPCNGSRCGLFGLALYPSLHCLRWRSFSGCC